ncbi:putative pectinesterase [Acidobacterium capsulatum ATCC 51196]|uniref:Pectinesterase n=2 Tax=Acidobacteriaceae TaxID=204434 RepID=C1F2N2_ACIC5|nr:putative pectinesterase [Acidobacterium capsulatum ATCC 51196]
MLFVMVRPRSFLALLLILSAGGMAHAANVTVLVRPGAPMFQPGEKPHGIEVFPTIENALDHAPLPPPGGRVIIRIMPGVYHERIWVPQNRKNVTLIGLGKTPAETVITAGHYAKEAGGTFFTETAEIAGNGFEADNLTFANSAGNVGQAVAVSVLADRVIFKHCRFLGYQDTLFANYGRQYYVDDFIEGAVDFIFGDAAAVFDQSEIHAVAPGYLTAQSRLRPDAKTGFVILNSRITLAPGIGEGMERHGREYVALGRPWRRYSRVVYLNTLMPAGILPQGWSRWGISDSYKTTFYAEAGSHGPGATMSERVPWERKLSAAQSRVFEPQNFLRGKDGWNPVAAAARLP